MAHYHGVEILFFVCFDLLIKLLIKRYRTGVKSYVTIFSRSGKLVFFLDRALQSFGFAFILFFLQFIFSHVYPDLSRYRIYDFPFQPCFRVSFFFLTLNLILLFWII